jgi:hypothetical protein
MDHPDGRVRSLEEQLISHHLLDHGPELGAGGCAGDHVEGVGDCGDITRALRGKALELVLDHRGLHPRHGGGEGLGHHGLEFGFWRRLARFEAPATR